MYNINISNRRTYSLNNNSNKSNNSTGTGSRNKKSIKTSLKNNKSNSKRSILSRHSIISNYKNKIIDGPDAKLGFIYTFIYGILYLKTFSYNK